MSPPDYAGDPGLPADLAATLQETDPETLRRVRSYVQTLLEDRSSVPREALTTSPDEELLRAVEREGYTAVVKRRNCREGCPDCPHGPYLYHVTTEVRPDGERHQNWTLLGETRE